jgi:hypothetical protein
MRGSKQHEDPRCDGHETIPGHVPFNTADIRYVPLKRLGAVLVQYSNLVFFPFWAMFQPHPCSKDGILLEELLYPRFQHHACSKWHVLY